MRPVVWIVAITLPLFLLPACGSSASRTVDGRFVPPNDLMAEEIDTRIEQIQYQHREELLDNLLWLVQTGESAIPATLRGLRHSSPKVRSSCAWVLGQMRDRRVMSDLEAAAGDPVETVQLEVARTLVVLGNLQYAPALIEALDSEKAQVRYLCHEALKEATGREFGYDHLSEDVAARSRSVLRWREWWAAQAGDPWFANRYARENGLTPDPQGQPAAPGVETQRPGDGQQPERDDDGFEIIDLPPPVRGGEGGDGYR